MTDNHIQQGNELQIDPRRVVWNRVMDMNDRALRHIVIGLGDMRMAFPGKAALILLLHPKSWLFFVLRLP